ncbi:WXG100 family type VII secretion target [Brachybacterium sp. DNPG3]
MNSDEGREVATALSEGSRTILDTIDGVTGTVNGVEWIGPDYDTFQEDWNAFVTGAVQALVDALDTKSTDLTANADEQDRTSNLG